jgi:hypothetical protein
MMHIDLIIGFSCFQKNMTKLKWNNKCHKNKVYWKAWFKCEWVTLHSHCLWHTAFLDVPNVSSILWNSAVTAEFPRTSCAQNAAVVPTSPVPAHKQQNKTHKKFCQEQMTPKCNLEVSQLGEEIYAVSVNFGVRVSSENWDTENAWVFQGIFH